MRVISLILLAMLVSGCSAIYDPGKRLYIGGKSIVVKNWDSLPEDVQNRLERVDRGLMKYDEVREDVKKCVIGE